jgi:general secretion pathway protein I
VKRTAAARGFTLIEVLVALVIVALGMGALLAALTSSADGAAYVRDKTFAEWVGLNRLAEVRLRNQQVSAKTEGDVEMAGRRWHWEQEGLELEVPGLVRVDVRVRLADVAEKDKDSWITTVSGIVGDKIARPGTVNVDWRGQPGGNPPNPNGPQNGTSPAAPEKPRPVTPAPDGSTLAPVPSGAEDQ